MRKLDRPSGYFQTWDDSGRKIEGETRTCAHCAFMWIYNPRESFDKRITGEYKPTIRGECMSCYGMVCARPQCMKMGCIPQAKQIALMEKQSLLLSL